MTDFARARRTMVDNLLRPSGVIDWRILDVMNRVPREVFVPEERKALAYIDESISLTASRSMLAPASLARLIQLAEVAPDAHVLDVGCGTGYSTAVLAGLAASVVGLDDDASLVSTGNTALATLEIANATLVNGALEKGVAESGPFDVILIEGAVDTVSETLLAQLKDGGRLLAVHGHGHAGVAHVYVRSGADISSRPAFNVSLPAITTFAEVPTFRF